MENLIWPKEYLKNALTIAQEIEDKSAVKHLNFCIRKLNHKDICKCILI